ncbi:WYL domain-containing protein [Massilia sp. TS11]|uniref:helix-turn-helix transcriptional regulator n=1 Tax=Massilia sp. TS11 TaxID=2908003 RepID=UPI0027D9807A|nr:WYL domain-containing protein [Massilia sp. TS11]
MAAQWGDPALRVAVTTAGEKIRNALPRDRRAAADAVALFAAGPPEQPLILGPLREAIDTRRKLTLDYADANGTPSTRTVWPLGLVCWGRVWTLNAWCELRQDFRDFRLERVRALRAGDQHYPQQAGRTLRDYWDHIERQHGVRMPAEWIENHGGWR